MPGGRFLAGVVVLAQPVKDRPLDAAEELLNVLALEEKTVRERLNLSDWPLDNVGAMPYFRTAFVASVDEVMCNSPSR